MALDISPELLITPAPELPTVPVPSSEEIYQARRIRFGAARDFYTERWNRVANVRLAVFFLAAACAGWGIWQEVTAAYVVAGALFLVFIGLVRYHQRLGRERQRYTILWEINDEAGQRVRRDWKALPLRSTFRAEADHPYAGDLDLFGRASLFHWLETVTTSMGETMLRDWLLAPAAAPVVQARQAAVAELAPLIDLRDDLALRGRRMGNTRPDPAPFLAWAEASPWLPARRGLVWAGRVSVVGLWASIIAGALGLLPLPLWPIFLIGNGIVLLFLLRGAVQVLNGVAGSAVAFRPYADALQLLAEAQFTAPALQQIQATLQTDGHAAHVHMRRLHTRIGWRFPQQSMLYGLIQLLTLWDVQVLALLEGWQREVGPRARAWLAALGEAEALAALAVPAHDNPDWVFPTLDPAAPALDARGLGHPLLPATARVVNDVIVGPPGTLLLVTGSNMSGKSTLLRALGVNIVLAQAGGPVCATALRLPPVTLWTSMRVQDSLERGVSYFMAELQRLKAVVDAARQVHTTEGPRLFYLLDEMLQGTNTTERQVAARRILLHLVAQGAIGAVSTHDLTLADSPDMTAVAHLIHFTERIVPGPTGPVMTFDYKSRPGLATSTNALKLMEIMGLDTGPSGG